MRLLIFAIIVLLTHQVSIGQVCPGTPGQVTYQYWENIPDDEMSILTSRNNFPQRPDIELTRYRLQAPINFNNYMGSRIIGFIKVPESTTATFNITGNDIVSFKLSTDDSMENLQEIASVPNNTSLMEHDKYPEQTSGPVTLVAGQHYYFELTHIDKTGGDHASVYWKTDLEDPTVWTLVSFQYLVDVDCMPSTCPLSGTPCNDGDNTTTDDIQDGYCNCYGKPTTDNTCIGDRGTAISYRYNVPGSSLSSLLNDPNFPAMPATSRRLQRLGWDMEDVADDFGEYMQGYLTVPVTGEYTFNWVSDDGSTFEMSSDEDMANLGLVDLSVNGWTNTAEHDKYETQTSAPVMLEAGKYYYYEVHQKEGGGREHYGLYWKTPYTPAGLWKEVTVDGLYNYTCSIACVPAGTPCDDGDPTTADDVYNDSCECVGTPCGGICDEDNFTAYDKCSVSEMLDNNEGSGWLSCNVTTNPNPNYGPPGHWIMYDLGERHYIFDSHVWNYNVAGDTNLGFERVSVDYSLDGVNWTLLGDYQWPLATGDPSYTGFVGPDFMGADVRYILISTSENSPCKGLGKVTFTAINCPVEGTICDDGDADTFDDAIDANCECVGKSFVKNDCVEEHLILGDSTLTGKKYSAIQTINSISGVDNSQKVSFVGGDHILFDVGFETEDEAVFIAVIDSCESTAGRGEYMTVTSQIRERRRQHEEDIQEVFQVITNDANDNVWVKYFLRQPSHVTIELVDVAGNTVSTLTDYDYANDGLYSKRFRTKKLSAGIYTVRFQTESGSLEERLTVTR